MRSKLGGTQMKKLFLCFALALSLPGGAQTWVKATFEAAGVSVTLPAGVTWRVGSPAQWCDTVTTTAAQRVTYPTICKINGVLASIPAANVELDVQQQTAAYTIQVTVGITSTAVRIAASGTAPPPQPPPLVTPGKTILGSGPATLFVYSDATWSCIPTAPLKAVP